MDGTEAAEALGEEQLLKQWRKAKQALKEAKTSVKDTRKLEKEFENAWESGGKAFRA